MASAQITSGIYTALRNEDVNIHSCAPGWTEVAGKCWLNPLTEPALGAAAMRDHLPCRSRVVAEAVVAEQAVAGSLSFPLAVL